MGERFEMREGNVGWERALKGKLWSTREVEGRGELHCGMRMRLVEGKSALYL